MTGFGSYYDRDGAPISLQRWGQLHKDTSYLVVAKTIVPIPGRWRSDPVCDSCWAKENDWQPVRLLQPEDEWCAACHRRTSSGIYMRRPAEVHVSTVWLGIDHNFGEHGPPVIFETMVFGGDRDGELVDRYTAELAALAGHDQAVAQVRDEARAQGSGRVGP